MQQLARPVIEMFNKDKYVCPCYINQGSNIDKNDFILRIIHTGGEHYSVYCLNCPKSVDIDNSMGSIVPTVKFVVSNCISDYYDEFFPDHEIEKLLITQQ